MVFKVITIILLLIIIYCLASGLYYLARQGTTSADMIKALAWRIVVSFCLFIFILAAYWMGWITPHGLIMSWHSAGAVSGS